MDLSVVIPSFEAADHLRACLDSLERATEGLPDLEVEVIVVDNGSEFMSTSVSTSTDDRPERMTRTKNQPRCVAFARNRGFAAAANYGMRLARGRHLLVLNSDARVTAALLEGAVAELDADPRIAVLGPALRHADGRPQRSVHRWPSLATEVFGDRVVDFVAGLPRAGWAPGKSDRDAVVDVPAVRGAVFFIGAAAREKLGGFDEGYFFFLEETDYCLRARAAGDRVVFAPGLAAEHALGASGKVRAPAAIRIEYHRSLERFLRRHRAPGVARIAMAFRAMRQTLVLPLLFVGAGLGRVTRARLLERSRLVLWHLRGRPGCPSLEAALRSTGGDGGSA